MKLNLTPLCLALFFPLIASAASNAPAAEDLTQKTLLELGDGTTFVFNQDLRIIFADEASVYFDGGKLLNENEDFPRSDDRVCTLKLRPATEMRKVVKGHELIARVAHDADNDSNRIVLTDADGRYDDTFESIVCAYADDGSNVLSISDIRAVFGSMVTVTIPTPIVK